MGKEGPGVSKPPGQREGKRERIRKNRDAEEGGGIKGKSKGKTAALLAERITAHRHYSASEESCLAPSTYSIYQKNHYNSWYTYIYLNTWSIY